jgi:hypothetical protein
MTEELLNGKIAGIRQFIKEHCFYRGHSLFLKKEHGEAIHLKSFSRISKPVAPDLSHIPVHILEAAGTRGNAIHEAIEQTFKIGIDILPDEQYGNYWEAFEKFRSENDFKIIATEFRVIDTEKFTSGIIDCILEMNGSHAIVDWKTSAKINPMLMGLQLFIYADMLRKNKIDINDLYICHLQKTGQYKLVKVDNKYFPIFEEVYKALI